MGKTSAAPILAWAIADRVLHRVLQTRVRFRTDLGESVSYSQSRRCRDRPVGLCRLKRFKVRMPSFSVCNFSVVRRLSISESSVSAAILPIRTSSSIITLSGDKQFARSLITQFSTARTLKLSTRTFTATYEWVRLALMPGRLLRSARTTNDLPHLVVCVSIHVCLCRLVQCVEEIASIEPRWRSDKAWPCLRPYVEEGIELPSLSFLLVCLAGFLYGLCKIMVIGDGMALLVWSQDFCHLLLQGF